MDVLLFLNKLIVSVERERERKKYYKFTIIYPYFRIRIIEKLCEENRNIGGLTI